ARREPGVIPGRAADEPDERARQKAAGTALFFGWRRGRRLGREPRGRRPRGRRRLRRLREARRGDAVVSRARLGRRGRVFTGGLLERRVRFCFGGLLGRGAGARGEG